MHIPEGKLRACLDGETSPSEAKQFQEHLDTCGDCQEHLETLRSRQGSVRSAFASLEPDQQTPSLSSRAAYLRIIDRAEAQLKETETMWQKLTRKSLRPVWTVLAVIGLVAILMFIPQVRAVAENFLGLFRVQTIQVVQFNPANLPQDLDSRMMKIDDLLADQIETQLIGDPVEVMSVSEASERAGFQVLHPKAWESPRKITYQPGGEAEFTIDVELMQLVLDELESDYTLPQALNGQKVSVEVPASVTIQLGNCPQYDPDAGPETYYRTENCTALVQMPSPTVNAPPGVDVQEVGQAMLQLLGFTPEEAVKFSQEVDWTTTLVIPIPQGVDFQEVSVNGTPATLLLDTQFGPNYRYTLFWTQDGIVYALSGRGTEASALELANSIE